MIFSIFVIMRLNFIQSIQFLCDTHTKKFERITRDAHGFSMTSTNRIEEIFLSDQTFLVLAGGQMWLMQEMHS